MPNIDASAYEALYGGGRPSEQPAFSPETGEMLVGNPVPEGTVISQRVGRAQDMAVMPPGSTQPQPGAPQIGVIPPTGSSRTTIGTIVDLPPPNAAQIAQTIEHIATHPPFFSDNQTGSLLNTNQLVATQLNIPVRKPKLDLTQAMMDHIQELGGPKSEKCQKFYDRAPNTLQNWLNNPGQIPLASVCRFLAKKPELIIEIEEDLEPHFAANGPEGWTQSLPTRGKASVVVCSPVLERPTLPFLWTLLYLAKKFELGFDIQADTMISRSRNMLAHRFLKSNAQWSLWIDGDMACPINNRDWFKWITGTTQVPDVQTNYDVLTRLQSHHKGMVGGVYASRKFHGSLVIQPEVKPRNQEDKELANEIRRGTASGLAQVEWIGFGCALVHRDIFLEVQRRFPELAPKAEFDPWGFFNSEGIEGEDEAFCRRVRTCQIPIWLDTQLICAHIGNFAFLPEHTSALPTV